MIQRSLAFLIALALLVGTGYVHGVWTHRWGPSTNWDQIDICLKAIPMSLGKWKGQDMVLEDGNLQKNGISGYWMRRFDNQQTRAVVSVLLVWGQAGKIAVHTPDVCYQGLGYDTTGAHSKYSVPGNSDLPESTFWTAVFRKIDSPTPSYLRLFWGWSPDGSWEAADNPRWQFAGVPLLFKLYLVRPTSESGEPLAAEPSSDLMHQLLPELRKNLCQIP